MASQYDKTPRWPANYSTIHTALNLVYPFPAVTHPSTDCAQCCLTSVIEGTGVRSTLHMTVTIWPVWRTTLAVQQNIQINKAGTLWPMLKHDFLILMIQFSFVPLFCCYSWRRRAALKIQSHISAPFFAPTFVRLYIILGCPAAAAVFKIKTLILGRMGLVSAQWG
jgi:hypothetical protein